MCEAKHRMNESKQSVAGSMRESMHRKLAARLEVSITLRQLSCRCMHLTHVVAGGAAGARGAEGASAGGQATPPEGSIKD